MMAGVAGALYVPQVGIINPGEFSPANSIEMVIWVAVGGRGTLVGAVIGAVVVNYGKTVFTTALPELWLFALGALFIAVTLFFPRGIVGAWTDYIDWMRRQKPDAARASRSRKTSKARGRERRPLPRRCRRDPRHPPRCRRRMSTR